jgi:hypothetical protein
MGLLGTVNEDRLPDDYGIDVALTVHALAEDRPVDQVLVPFPDHEAGTNSAEIMGDVARTLLGLGARDLQVQRTDVGRTGPRRRRASNLATPPGSVGRRGSARLAPRAVRGS